MCGIVAQIAKYDIAGDTLDRLARIEYRGYDSYGIGVWLPGGLLINKNVGSVGDALNDKSILTTSESNVAIAHTRWATHGKVSQANAQPHISFDGRIAIVHNGVIENNVALRRYLQTSGVRLSSDTDSEVVAHLIALQFKESGQALRAVMSAIRQLIGEYALAILFNDCPDYIYGAKRRSPLLAASNAERAALASDVTAVADLTHDVVHLEDGDVARLAPGKIEIFGDGNEVIVSRPIYSREQAGDPTSLPDKGTYQHFMIKEIWEIPTAVQAALSISNERFTSLLRAFSTGDIGIIGSGSSYYVALLAQYLFMALASIRTSSYTSDEVDCLAKLGTSEAYSRVAPEVERDDG